MLVLLMRIVKNDYLPIYLIYCMDRLFTPTWK